MNDLLAAEFEGNPLIEWMDLMQYGFWGEGHTSNFPNPFPDYVTAERTFVKMTARQLDTWKKTPLAVNTQPDISNVGNRTVIDMAVRAGAWMRSDSIIVEEPIQIDELANRPPWTAAILEDGYFRQYDTQKLKPDAAGINVLENYMLHVLDVRANYWALWTEADNLARYNEMYPRGFERLRTNMGYRLRPSWVWQRKRYEHFRSDRMRQQPRSGRGSGRAVVALGESRRQNQFARSARRGTSSRRWTPASILSAP